MNASPTTMTAGELKWELPTRGHVGMLSLIAGETSIFVIFVVAYIYYIGKSLTGPMPREALEVPIFFTICLLSSSLTIHFAVKALRRADIRGFVALVASRRLRLVRAFLYGTAREWQRLIYEVGLTISTNLFGTTYYSLVGLHGFHVVVGLILLSAVMAFTWLGHVRHEHTYRVDVLSLYWHFVDAVWVVVFTVVYIIGR